jgi:hypothetical protein
MALARLGGGCKTLEAVSACGTSRLRSQEGGWKMRTFVLGRRRLRAVVVALSAVVVGGTWLVVGGANPAQATTTLATFDVPGTYMWTVPTSVTKITFTVYGASGGNVTTTSPFRVLTLGGTGGEAVGTIKVKPGETFEISVGGRGGDGINQTPGAAGSNGGGPGGGGTSAPDAAGGGGGGASDVRIGGSGNSCASSTSCTTIDRIIVGGAGAGGGQNSDGGAGGGVFGGAGGSTGGGQEGLICSGSDPFADDAGCFGLGGGPFDSFFSNVGDGGGGGGWFGGSGGALSHSDYAGGGGGSGYISALALKGSFPGGTRSGDGEVIITTP